jgi:hypothetical protein
MIFPVPVTRKVFFAPLWVFIFGIYLLLLLRRFGKSISC